MGNKIDGLSELVAKNAKAAYLHSGFRSYRELAIRAGVAPNSVKYLLEPDKRPATGRVDPSPRLDVLDKIAKAMGYSAWQMMLSEFDPQNPPERNLTRRENDFYKKIEKAYDDLDKGK